MSDDHLSPIFTNSSHHETSRRNSGRYSDDADIDSLHDHRMHPNSLPLQDIGPSDGAELTRVDSTVSRRSLYRNSSTKRQRPRKYSFGEDALRRSRSVASCAVSESSGDNINARVLDHQRERRKSTARSMNSQIDDDVDSQRSLSEDTDEDVCFPMTEKEQQPGIDFRELDEFTESTRQTGRPSTSQGDISNMKEPESVPLLETSGPEERRRTETEDSNGTVFSLPGPGITSDRRPSSEETESVDEKEEEDKRTSYFSPELRPNNPGVSFGASRVEPDTQSSDEEPMRFSFFASNTVETIHAADLPSLVDEGQSFQDLFNADNGIWWLDCFCPTDAEMKTLSKAFGIHPLTTEDIRTEESREKVELFKKYYFVSFHTFEDNPEHEDYLEPINFYIVVFRDGILSFHFSPIPNCANVRRRVRQLREYVKVTADWLSYALIDDITDSFAPIIHEVELEVDVIEDSVFIARESDIGHILRRISEARRTSMTLLRLLSGKADVIKMFAKRCNENWDSAPNGEIGLFLGDIQDHIITMYQNLTVYEKIMSRCHANYLAQLQVENVASSNRVTRLLGRATIIGTILVPMNLITGMFGMNVRVPGEQGPNLGWFFGILGVMLLLITGLGWASSRYLSGMENESDSAMTSSGSSVLSSRSSRSRRLRRFLSRGSRG